MKRRIDFHFNEYIDHKYVIWIDKELLGKPITYYAIKPVKTKLGKDGLCSNSFNHALLFDTEESALIYHYVLSMIYKDHIFNVTTVKEMNDKKVEENIPTCGI